MTLVENPGAVLMFVISAASRMAQFEKTMRSLQFTSLDASRAIANLRALADEIAEPLSAWENEGGALEEYVK